MNEEELRRANQALKERRAAAEPTEAKLLTEDSVNVPLGAVVIPLSEYKELVRYNAMMECMLDDIMAYVKEETYIRRDTILQLLGVKESLDE